MDIYITIILIAAFMFLLGQTIQALSTLMLIGIWENLLQPMLRSSSSRRSHFHRGLLILNITLFFLLINSLLQIGVWAASFVLFGQFPTYGDAFYHSAVNFASLGYGDIVMKPPWRLLGALEAVSGVLMLGLSAATLSTVVRELLQRRQELRTRFSKEK